MKSKKQRHGIHYILIVDKQGVLGSSFLDVVKQQAFVIFVTGKFSKNDKDTLVVPYHTTIPQLPELVYSEIYVVADTTTVTHEAVSVLLEKAEKDKARFVYITSIFAHEEKLAQKITSYAKGKFIILGDVFGNSMLHTLFSKRTEIFFQTAKNEGKVTLSHDGLLLLYPVFFQDAVDRIGNSDKTKANVICLFQKSGIPELTFSHMMQKAMPELHIDFAKASENTVYVPSGDTEFLDEDYALSLRVKTYLQTESKYILAPPKNTERSGFLTGVLISLFVFFLLPFLTTLLLSALGFFALARAKEDVGEGDVASASRFVKSADFFLKLSQKTATPFVFEANIIGLSEMANAFQKRIDLGHSIAEAGAYVADATSAFAASFTGKDTTRDSSFLQGVSALQHATVIFDRLQATSDTNQLLTKFSAYALPLRFFATLSDVLPELMGFGKEKTYLVLFQNNMELRPGGGFIGSYGLFSLHNAIVKDFSIHDVYDADGELRGHVEPPFPLRRYLPTAHWYLRDSNFSPDFPLSASQSAFLLKEETGQAVDGVIAIDVTVLQKILENIGPVFVPEYSETVTSQNLFEKTESHAEKNFFPGSTQKKDFLKSLFAAIQATIKNNKSYEAVFKAIVVSFSEKHILIASATPSIQNMLTVNALSSSLWDARENNVQHIADFFGLSEANIGVDKTNYFLTRQVVQRVSVDTSGEITEKATITYKNSSTSWPGGLYRNYLRIILPKDTVLTGVSINNEEKSIVPAVTDFFTYESPLFTPPQGLEVARTDEMGKTLYGFLVTVPEKQTTTVTLSYKLVQKITVFDLPSTYDLLLFKQPGTLGYEHYVSVTLPSSLRVSSETKDFSLDTPNADVSMNTDHNLILMLSKR